MSSTSKNSLFSRIDELAARYAREDTLPPDPPLIAGQSPLHELLTEELAGALPTEVAKHLKSASTVCKAQDWLTAGAVYASVSDDPSLAAKFLREVGDNPREAGLALARAIAWRMEPPPRDASWYARDRVGLGLQLAAACAFLACRGFLFNLFISYVTESSPRLGPGSWLHDPVGWGLLLIDMAGGLVTGVILGAASVWLAVEAIVGPKVMELLRKLPAKRRGLPPPLSWRTDAFYACWFGQAIVFHICTSIRCYVHIVQWAFSANLSAGEWISTLMLASCFPIILWAVYRCAGTTLKLGMNTRFVETEC